VRRLSLPAAHRQVLLALFEDLVRWLVVTNPALRFRPRRN
jgi:hypothetical protein